MDPKVKLGFTLAELLIALAIIAILAALSFGGIQQVRAAARQTVCQNNIRQLSLAVYNFESANSRLPLGTNSYLGNVEWDDFRNTEDGLFWKKKPQSSFVALILSHIEAQSLEPVCDDRFFNTHQLLYDNGYRESKIWFAELRGFSKLAETPLNITRCPSDNLPHQSKIKFAGGSQPVNYNGTDAISYVRFLEDFSTIAFQPTNYLACMGASSATESSSLPGNEFSGLLSSGESLTFSCAKDGLSSTILLGESIGEVLNGNRVAMQPWCVGGLARGRGKSSWHSTEVPFLGDSQNAGVFGFSSMHPQIVIFAFADGSTHSISTSVDRDTYYALCGRRDGQVIKSDY